MSYSDTFTDAENTTLPDHNVNWGAVTGISTGLKINALGYAVGITAAANNANVYSGGTFANGQYAEVKIIDATNAYVGPMCRITGSSWYGLLLVDATTLWFYKNGATLGGAITVPTMVGGDIIKLEVLEVDSVTTLKAYVNDSIKVTATDESSPIASGKAGVFAYSTAGVNEWGAGDLILLDITQSAATSIGTTTATGHGNIVDNGGQTITEVGVCVDETNNPPTVSDTCFTATTVQSGAFAPSMTGLTAGTTYHYRAYCKVGATTYYGDTVSIDFETEVATVGPPDIHTGSSQCVGGTCAMVFGYITHAADPTTNDSITELGFVYGTSDGPTIGAVGR